MIVPGQNPIKKIEKAISVTISETYSTFPLVTLQGQHQQQQQQEQQQEQ